MTKAAFKERVRRFFTENIWLKLLAVFIALVIWIVFHSTQDPIGTATYRIPLAVVNLDKYETAGHYIELSDGSDISNQLLTITVRARNSVLHDLTNSRIEEIISAYVDVYELEEDHLNIHYSVIPEYEDKLELVTLSNRKYLDVNTEDIATKQLPIEMVLLGSVAEGYLLEPDSAKFYLSQDSVTLTGPASKIAAYASVKAEIPLNEAKSDISTLIVLSFYDAAGRRIVGSVEGVTVSASDISAMLPVYRLATLPIVCATSGSAASGWEYLGDLGTNVKQISVYGKSEALEKVTGLTLPAIDLSSVKGEYKVSYDLKDLVSKQFGGALTVYSKETSVTVSLHTEEIITKTIELFVNQVSLRSFDENKWKSSYDIVQSISGPVVLRGRKSLVEKLGTSLTYYVDMSNFAPGEGEKRFNISFELPAGVTQQNTPQLIFKMTAKPAGLDE